MKNKYLLLFFVVGAWTLGACGDVESAGAPQARIPRVEVEATDYYVQITQENVGGSAFVYRWLDMETAAKYIITLSQPEEAAAAGELSLEIPDTSILTYNGVRELQFSNKDIMGFLNSFGLWRPGHSTELLLSLTALNATGTAITADLAKASKTSTLHVLVDANVDFSN